MTLLFTVFKNLVSGKIYEDSPQESSEKHDSVSRRSVFEPERTMPPLHNWYQNLGEGHTYLLKSFGAQSVDIWLVSSLLKFEKMSKIDKS